MTFEEKQASNKSCSPETPETSFGRLGIRFFVIAEGV